ncbi:MAG: hypothetical protein U1E18_18655, partial [Brevundimonas sp.]|uniref:CpaD family pilus assembly lipoprotein n=1 Tax=Brevundimonas sp. TaxID=1871086 RepID=UPI002AB9577B
MNRSVLLVLALLALPLAAAQAGRYNRGVESVHQPIVQRHDYVLDISGEGLDPVAAARVRQWLDAIGLAYGDRISIDGSAGHSGSNRQIADIVGDYGLFV